MNIRPKPNEPTTTCQITRQMFGDESDFLSMNEDKMKDLRNVLGSERELPNEKFKATATGLHTSLAFKFYSVLDAVVGHIAIVSKLLEENGDNCQLKYLLTRGTSGSTVLHVLLDPARYDPDAGPFDLDKVKPLIRFLLRIHPRLPKITDSHRRTPLFRMIVSPVNQTIKQDGVQFLCSDKQIAESLVGTLATESALESLAMVIRQNDEQNICCHAVHKAIEENVMFEEKLIRKLTETKARPIMPTQHSATCLLTRNGEGMTCLHLALTAPFSDVKVKWAGMLAEIEHSLLREKSTPPGNGSVAVTPMQYFTEQRGKQKSEKDVLSVNFSQTNREHQLDTLENSLKRLCLLNFDDVIAQEIIYRKENVRQISLAFQEGDVISARSLNRLSRHYKLDKMLHYVYIPKITVKWDDYDLTLRRTSRRCLGKTDLVSIFGWLKNAEVKKILTIVVDDFDHGDVKSHSDEAILTCLQNFEIETWDWRRLDVSSELIFEIAENHVAEVHLYCSGLKAVFQSWSDIHGLPRLRKLERVYYEVHQGLESIAKTKEYADKFERELEDNFFSVNNRKLTVKRNRIIPAEEMHNAEQYTTSKIKNDGEEGFEEQDWLKCMDELAYIVTQLDSNQDQVKVALIDDGVQSNFAGLDDNIEAGATFVTPGRNASTKRYVQNYNTSLHGHGTVMAYYIRRVCPRARLYVAKLDGTAQTRGVSFSIESATAAIDWAVDNGVDIISMSWAIDLESGLSHDEQLVELNRAIRNAGETHKIPLFCANPDRGYGYKTNNTYPQYGNKEFVFCVGAATSDGARWRKIAPDDDSTDFFLPGVDLGIPLTRGIVDGKGQPPGTWEKYSGSSISCALAAGLAAMILQIAKISEVEDDEWRWLKTSKGMKEAFKSVYMTADGWIPVRRLFGIRALEEGNDEDKKNCIKKEIMGHILSRMY